jgi:hypothetical protein
MKKHFNICRIIIKLLVHNLFLIYLTDILDLQTHTASLIAHSYAELIPSYINNKWRISPSIGQTKDTTSVDGS